MASENLEIAPQNRVLISLPRKYMAALSKHYPLDHGLLIMNLGHNINEGYLRAYFKEYGDITMCKIKTCSNSSKNKLAFVRFRTADEADRADWAGPHDISGTEIKVKRVVSPKSKDEPDDEPIPLQTRKSLPRGLCYMLEDPEWLDDDEEQSKQF